MIHDAVITNRKSGIRLDAALLAAFPTSTRRFIRESIESGHVEIASRRAFKGEKLHGGEKIIVRELLESSDNKVIQDPSVQTDLVYEDPDLLAFDKPVGMKVQPLTCRETSTLMNGVVAKWPECATAGDTPLMAGALHRIDAGTSGLVLVARNRTAFERVRAQFSLHSVEKTYLAMVEGTVEDGGTLENDLVHDTSVAFCRMTDVKRARSAIRGKPLHAVTSYRPLFRTKLGCEDRTLLEVKIFTGVTHQIRSQLAMAGMHIINDTLYGAFAVENATGHMLHSLGARFVHPSTGLQISISTAVPRWALPGTAARSAFV